MIKGNAKFIENVKPKIVEEDLFKKRLRGARDN